MFYLKLSKSVFMLFVFGLIPLIVEIYIFIGFKFFKKYFLPSNPEIKKYKINNSTSFYIRNKTRIMWIEIGRKSNLGIIKPKINIKPSKVNTVLFNIENEMFNVKNDSSNIRNENSKIKNGVSKVKNEASKVENEASKVKNEASKVKNESSNVKNETSKVENETSKVNYKVLNKLVKLTISINNESNIVICSIS
jgi:hypothetical protein